MYTAAMLCLQTARHAWLLLHSRHGQAAISISISQAMILAECDPIPLESFEPVAHHVALIISNIKVDRMQTQAAGQAEACGRVPHHTVSRLQQEQAVSSGAPSA